MSNPDFSPPVFGSRSPKSQALRLSDRNAARTIILGAAIKQSAELENFLSSRIVFVENQISSALGFYVKRKASEPDYRVWRQKLLNMQRTAEKLKYLVEKLPDAAVRKTHNVIVELSDGDRCAEAQLSSALWDCMFDEDTERSALTMQTTIDMLQELISRASDAHIRLNPGKGESKGLAERGLMTDLARIWSQFFPLKFVRSDADASLQNEDPSFRVFAHTCNDLLPKKHRLASASVDYYAEQAAKVLGRRQG